MVDRMTRQVLVVAGLGFGLACFSGPPGPAALDTRNEQCAFCRMAVSDPRFAAQLVAPSEETRFFDDIGCLAGYLKAMASLPKGAAGYVADHQSKAWVRAEVAVYTQVPTLETPMASHVIAHADLTSRDRDLAAKGGRPLTLQEVYGTQGPPRPAE